MTAADFDTQFNRLTAHFHLPVDGNRDALALDWFRAVESWPVEALERGVTHLVTTSTERFWPALGALLEAIRSKTERTGRGCATCHGSGWLETHPFLSNGMVYSNVVVRCGDCGIPAPAVEARGRRPLTAPEYRAWHSGERSRDYMPDGVKAKPWKPGVREAHQAEMRRAFERLRLRLFGQGAA